MVTEAYKALSPPFQLWSSKKAETAKVNDARYELVMRVAAISNNAFLLGKSDS